VGYGTRGDLLSESDFLSLHVPVTSEIDRCVLRGEEPLLRVVWPEPRKWKFLMQLNAEIGETSPPLLLELTDIHKSFPGVQALRGISFAVRESEIHALAGENGAGKSTLMHILAGVYPPDRGTITFDQCRGIRIESERMSQQLGISMVYQERSLIPSLSVAENIFAARQPANRWGIINFQQLNRRAKQLLDQLELEIDPRTLVDRLSPAQQQMVEIAKALSLNARLVIFDEPTSTLTEAEAATLFRIIAQLKRKSVSVIYISHHLEEIFKIADRVTVLKDGEYLGTFEVSQITPAALIRLMVGRDIKMNPNPQNEPIPAGSPVALEVRHFSDHRLLKDVNFSVQAGEIVALAGLAGAGRTELALSIFGAATRISGEIFLNGKPVQIQSPQGAIAVGIGYVPEERREAGLFLEMSIANNTAAARLNAFGSWWMDDRKRDTVAAGYCRRLNIAAQNVQAAVQNLSGGNQQKVVLSKWLLLQPKVLIVDEPTRGIDVGAKAEVHRLLYDLARQGTSVILISSDLPEILALADRVLVMRLGQIAGELTRQNATEEKILHYAAMSLVH
jgi:ribose transport system ATP-binding protein